MMMMPFRMIDDADQDDDDDDYDDDACCRARVSHPGSTCLWKRHHARAQGQWAYQKRSASS
jgi:hypothetical protein